MYAMDIRNLYCCMLVLYQPFMKLWVGKKLMFDMLSLYSLYLFLCGLTMGDIRAHIQRLAWSFVGR